MAHEDWGEGPWNNEPDRDVWVDPITDLDCLINRGPSGAWCGYVGVGPDHPLHGVQYDDVDVDVHGGLTYSVACQGEPAMSGNQRRSSSVGFSHTRRRSVIMAKPRA